MSKLVTERVRYSGPHRASFTHPSKAELPHCFSHFATSCTELLLHNVLLHSVHHVYGIYSTQEACWMPFLSLLNLSHTFVSITYHIRLAYTDCMESLITLNSKLRLVLFDYFIRLIILNIIVIVNVKVVNRVQVLLCTMFTAIQKIICRYFCRI